MIGEIIKKLRLEAGMTQKELSKKTGVSVVTIRNWEGGIKMPSTNAIIAIADIFHVSADYLLGIDSDPKPGMAISLPEAAFIKQYRSLDAHSKKIVDTICSMEVARPEKPTKSVPLFGQRFAAGPAEPDFFPPVETYSIPADETADFAIHINGTSMEPYLKDGSIALGIRRMPRDWEVGAFMLDGEFLVKQYLSDPMGNVYLFSANRKESDKDRVLLAVDSENHELSTFGTILTDRRLPVIRV